MLDITKLTILNKRNKNKHEMKRKKGKRKLSLD